LAFARTFVGKVGRFVAAYLIDPVEASKSRDVLWQWRSTTVTSAMNSTMRHWPPLDMEFNSLDVFEVGGRGLGSRDVQLQRHAIVTQGSMPTHVLAVMRLQRAAAWPRTATHRDAFQNAAIPAACRPRLTPGASKAR